MIDPRHMPAPAHGIGRRAACDTFLRLLRPRSPYAAVPHAQPHALEKTLGSALVERAAELTERWLRKVSARLPVEENRVFPTDELLDHVPEVIDYVGRYIAAGGTAEGEEEVRRVLRGLAALRREQGYHVDEILAEIDLLGTILFEELEGQARELTAITDPDDAVAASQRLYHALLGVSRLTAEVFREEGIGDRRSRAKLLGDFGASLAHELRNRLQAARAALAVLAAPGDLAPERVGEVAERLGRSLAGLEHLADDVRTLSLSGASEEAVLARRRPLAAICRDVVAQLTELAAAQGVELSLSDDLDDLRVDASRVELTLVNLVTNGIRHRDPAEPRPWVRVRTRRLDDSRVRVEVRDNGPGVPPEDRRRIFERHQRGGGAAEGDGLGLAIARAAIEQLGGEVGVESHGERGSTFWFTVPPVRNRT
jgi:signal transduction histidine kinase